MNRLLVSVLLCISAICMASAQETAAVEGERDGARIETDNSAQKRGSAYLEKRYNLFFRINSPVIDRSFKDNAKTIETMRSDIEATLEIDGVVPDSLLILSTASPDGG